MTTKAIVGLGVMALGLGGSYICKRQINKMTERILEKEAVRQGAVRRDGSEVIVVRYKIHD